MDDYTVITHRPHRQTFVPIGLSDLTIEVSSVHHDIGPPPSKRDLCVLPQREQ